MEVGSSSSEGDNIPLGPYFYSHGNLYKAYRLYVDELSASMFGTYTPDGDIYHDMVGAELPGDITPTIAVPSRLYYEVTKSQPLAGLRIAVKDIIDVKGVKSSCGSRAYYRLYDKPAKLASALKALTDLGAVVVGKTRTNQFASGDQPTANCVDFAMPVSTSRDSSFLLIVAWSMGYLDP